MKFKIKKLKECARAFEIEVPAEEVDREFKEVYDGIRKKAQVPGFRPGKAPDELLKKYYANTAREEVLKRLISSSYHRALKEAELSAIGLPQISNVNLRDDNILMFVATLEVKPTVKLRNYKGLKVKKNIRQVTEEDIEKVLKYLQDINAEFVNINERAVQMGDHIVCDIESLIDGKPQEKKKGIWFSVDEKFKIKGFCDQLMGTKAGETKDVKVILPDDYPAKEFAGKNAVFKIKINQIKQKRLHPIDDEFAKHLGKFQSLTELRQGIKKDLEVSAEKDARVDTENQLLDQLVKDSSFEIPDSLLEAQVKRLLEHAKHDLKNRGFTEEQMKAKEPQLRESLEKNAQRQVRIYFILEEVANTENIKITQPEIDKGIRDFAQKAHKTFEEVKDYLQEKDILDDFVAELREEKTIQFLLQNAVVT